MIRAVTAAAVSTSAATRKTPLDGRVGNVAVAGAGSRAAEAAGFEGLRAAAGVVHQGQNQRHHLQAKRTEAGQQSAPHHHPAGFLGLPDPVQAAGDGRQEGERGGHDEAELRRDIARREGREEVGNADGEGEQQQDQHAGAWSAFPPPARNPRPSAVTRAGPHWARTVWPSGKKRPCSTRSDSHRGTRITTAAARTCRAAPQRTASTAAASATAIDSGQLAAAVVMTAVQAAAVSAVKGWRRAVTASSSVRRPGSRYPPQGQRVRRPVLTGPYRRARGSAGRTGTGRWCGAAARRPAAPRWRRRSPCPWDRRSVPAW